MSVITAIRPKGTSRDRFIVEVDEKALCTVGPDLILRFSLHTGDALTSEMREALVEAAGQLAADDRAIRMLAARGRSKKVLERRLVEKGESRAHAQKAVERLSSLGVLDDATYARQFVRSKARSMGRRRIAFELSQQGVAPELARAALDEVLADETLDAKETIDVLAAKKLKQLAKVDETVRRRRITGFLARRGFGGSEIRDALARAERSES